LTSTLTTSTPTARLLPVLALLCALGFVATFLVALHTGRGLHDDAALFHHVYGNTALPVRAAGAARTLLLGIDAAFVAVAASLLAVLSILQKRFGRAVAAVAIVVCSVGSVEALKHGLPRLSAAIPAGRVPTFPSGHTSIAVSLGLALVLAAPSVLRPAAALVGAAYAAGVGLSLILLGWHFPSDVVGSFFVCGFWAAAIAAALPRTVARPAISGAGALVGVAAVAAGLVLAAVVAGRHPAAVEALRSARSVLATAAMLGMLSAVVFGAYTSLVGETRE
jgi:membrane-associated phospholipid phosphatase